MPSGSCFCGNIKIEYTGEPVMTVLCHCVDCRKIGGGNYSNNILVPNENFKLLSGTPKTFTKTAASGKKAVSSFCDNCGTTLFFHGESFGGESGLRVIKTGILDDVEVINNTKPGAEFFAAQRISWVGELPGAAQVEGMPPA